MGTGGAAASVAAWPMLPVLAAMAGRAPSRSPVAMVAAISPVAMVAARFFTSPATTANPLPAKP